MLSEDDLGIDENNRLEQYTLQKITLEWLNWNAQFFEYSEEPYLFYLAEILSKDFTKDEARLFYDHNTNLKQLPKFMMMFKNFTNSSSSFGSSALSTLSSFDGQQSYPLNEIDSENMKHFDVYSPFRLLANAISPEFPNFQLNSSVKNNLANYARARILEEKSKNKKISDTLVPELANKDFLNKCEKKETQWISAEKAMAQRQLRQEYSKEKGRSASQFTTKLNRKTQRTPLSYLDINTSDETYMELRDYYRKQTERALQEEEAKKVFVIINSFGGSVGNGITVHDALQFIKAGSLTLALGVAASAASLALAGGTIGERYVTEGCHVMLHQPEGGLSGQASDIWIDSKEIMKIRLDVAEIYSLSTYRPRHKILRDLDRDFYLNATETIFYGLADEIATNEVMHEIIEMTSKVWDYHDSTQQRLLESRDTSASGLETQSAA